LKSFLIEITALILAKRDVDVFHADTKDRLPDHSDKFLVDIILDKTGNKGTGKMTVKEGAERSIALGTMAAALDMRFIAADKPNRLAMSAKLTPVVTTPTVDRAQLEKDVEAALYCSKICSYAQGMNLIRTASQDHNWGVNLGECARIWKGGCIIRAQFLDLIKQAYDRDAALPSLLVDPSFMQEIVDGQASWRRIVALCATSGLPAPSVYASLAYFDAYRTDDLVSSSLVQAQRDFFGSHTFERKDQPEGQWYHCKWTDAHA